MATRSIERVVLVVVDSLGVGALPDAAAYGDEGSDTVGNIGRACGLAVPTLRALGLERVSTLAPAGGVTVRGACGRMAEASPGKDSVTGHWEIAGIVLDRPFPTFPHGFPADLIVEFERRIGRRTLGNVVASGTEIIDRLGAEHVSSGAPIVYTSADSVCQIAAHEGVVPIDELYRMCEVAFDIFCLGHGVGRTIARPFEGAVGAFRRTARRHDYALSPTGRTLLDALADGGVPITSVGKVRDLFAGRHTGRAVPTASDAEGMAVIDDALERERRGLVFANLVDSDTHYGHRNDTKGYAANLETIDRWLGALWPRLVPSDLLLVTGDHGNDPTTPSTDHSREYVPVLAAGPRVRAGQHLGDRPTFADLGQTVADIFGVQPLAHGSSFLESLCVDHS